MAKGWQRVFLWLFLSEQVYAYCSRRSPKKWPTYRTRARVKHAHVSFPVGMVGGGRRYLGFFNHDFGPPPKTFHFGSPEKSYVYYFVGQAANLRAPQKGPENWCRAKIVERCLKVFLTHFGDIFCPARKLSKNIEIWLDTL